MTFCVSVDKVEVEPVIRYNNTNLTHLDEEDDDNEAETIVVQNGGYPLQNGRHHHVVENGAAVTDTAEEVDEEPPVNIISGPDWESVNYTVRKVTQDTVVADSELYYAYSMRSFLLKNS